MALITEAKKLGADATCETCPHYLVLTEADVKKLGTVAKCAPPLRSANEREKLWERLLAGEVTTVGSDHSPSPPGMKTDVNFFKVWGGISGVQHTLPLLVTEGHANRGAPLSLIAKLTSFNVAQRFKLPATKGRIAVGADADVTLIDLQRSFRVRAEDLFYRHQQSPYVGRALHGKVLRTFLRGQTIFRDGKMVAKPSGNLVKPAL
jgi:allantoinase